MEPEQTLSVTLSAAAARRVAQLAEQQGNPDLMLRVRVSGGGCSGFQYEFSLEQETDADDSLFTHGGTQLAVDSVSLDFLKGATIDFVEDLMGAAFRINNPNANSACGCGNSFSI